MAKGKPKQDPSVFGPAIDGLKQHALAFLQKTIHEKIKKIEKMTLEAAIALLFFVIGTFFVLKAVVFYLNEFAGVSFTWGFLLVGLAAMGVASIFYFLIKHQ